MPYCITDFHHIRPRYEIDQEEILEWIARTHARATAHEEHDDYAITYRQLKEKIARLGVGKERIATRGVHLHDILRQEQEIYSVATHPQGRGFTERSQFFDREASEVLHAFYPEGCALPPHLIHVTCTGYVTPSPVQKLVAARGAGEHVTVTHAYHMGCYGALAALRIGSGFLHGSAEVDVIHTELCSLHMHPLRHSTEQLLVESLFADGFIKYRLASQASLPNLKILGLREEILPDSTHCMSWRCEDHGLSMTLSKEVPVRIGRSLQGYLERLCLAADVDVKEIQAKALFAVHPGGPKILTYIEEILALSPAQIQHSKDVLFRCGNMSSATLPHIWEKILCDPSVPNGNLLVSMAFGPGLSISGGLFVKSV